MNSRDARARILEAAEALLTEADPETVSVEAICARASVARATFYRHFPHKADLLADLAAQTGTTLPAATPPTRTRILDAAAELVLRQGLTATTMEQIAAAAGISPPTIYRHFASKDALLIALIEHVALLPEIRSILANGGAGDPATDLRALGRLLLVEQADRFAVIAVCLAEGPAHPTVGAEVLRRVALPVWQEVGAYLEAQVAAGRLRPAPTLPRVYTLAGVVTSFALARRLFGEHLPFTAEQLAETHLSTFLEGAATPSYRDSLRRATDGDGRDDASLAQPP
jgi:AcrR family transcriptional regulator